MTDTPPLAVSIRARDRRSLAGLLQASPAPRGALLINSGTGFLREFYLPFASYCAKRGYHTLVYDYRGIGASATQPLTRERARMSDWGRLDMPSALDWLRGRYPQLPLVTLGHSAGGQLIGCMDNEAQARAHVMIAASTGYWARQRAPFRYQALIFWKLYGPWQLRLRGYVPRGMLWRGAPLARGVFAQWRSWCLTPVLFGPQLDPDLADSRFDQVRGPLLSWGFSDDPIATPAAVTALLASYSNARIERRWSSARELGVRFIGHHGFFTAIHRDSLWAGALDWLDAHCA